MTIAGTRRASRVFYPSSDHMGDHEIQRFIMEMLRPLIERLFRDRKQVAHVGADTFFYWVEGDPKTCIAPDVYVIPGVSQALRVPSWLLWKYGAPPSFALEVVGNDIDKDYVDAPPLHAQLGTRELVIFDPHWTPRTTRRVRWQHFQRDTQGALQRVSSHDGDRIECATLDARLRVATDRDGQLMLRVGTGPEGEVLVPTARDEEEARETLEAENAALRARLAER